MTHPDHAIEEIRLRGVISTLRHALRRAGDFVEDEVQMRTEAGGEETDYVREAQDVLDVIDGALST